MKGVITFFNNILVEFYCFFCLSLKFVYTFFIWIRPH